ncbi:MAG: hypothetical protein AAGB00_11005 [Planctomycetota bacterium]
MSSHDSESDIQRLLEGQEELMRKQIDTHEIVVRISAYLKSELGFDSDAQGSVNRLMSETWQKVCGHERLLRGEGEQIGIVGWVQLLRRTWWGVLVALGTLGGYVVGSVFPIPGQQ